MKPPVAIPKAEIEKRVMKTKKRNDLKRVRVNAIDCIGCTIRTDGVYVAALGLRNIAIRVKDGVVEVRRRREVKER